MPKVVRYGGLNLATEALRIEDIAPKAVPMPVADADFGFGMEGEAPEFEVVPGGAAESGALPQAGDGAPEALRVAPQRSAGAGSAVTSEIIQSAMAEAGRIMEDALREAQRAKEEALAGVMAEAEEIRRRAAAEGRAEAAEAVAATARQAAKDLEAAVANFEGQRAGFEAEYEEQLKWLAIEIAGKVLAKKVGDDDAEMTAMVEKAVQSVQNEAWVRVEVAQEMVRLIDTLTQVYDDVSNVQISPIPAEPGTVHIETPSGVVDVSLRTQLANLREYFVTGTS